MCLNCGCGEPDKRHHPTDITREDLQRAADGTGMTLRQAAENLASSSQEVAGSAGGEPPRKGEWATTKPA